MDNIQFDLVTEELNPTFLFGVKIDRKESENQYIPGSHRYIFIIQMIESLTLQNNSNLWKIMTMVIIFALFTINLYPK